MSSMFGGITKTPQVAAPAKVVEKDTTSPKSRGASGRTILAGAITGATEDIYKKKSILGG